MEYNRQSAAGNGGVPVDAEGPAGGSLSARVPVPGSERAPVPGAVRVGETARDAPVAVTVVLKPAESLSEHVAKISAVHPQEKSPEEHHEEYAAAFGADPKAIFAVREFAEQHGLEVIEVDAKRRVVKLSGPAAAAESAFGTSLADYRIDDKTFRGREGRVLVPPAIEPFVEAVLGLDSRQAARPRVVPRAAVHRSYYPNELAELYRFPNGDGANQTVALIELGGNYDEQDLGDYFNAAGTPVPVVRRVSVTPGSPVPYRSDPVSDGEVMLDIEVVGAIAPRATIVVYFAANTDDGFYEAVSQAVHDPATTVVSISWGGAEKYFSDQTMDAWETLAMSAAALHVPIFAASGDHGAPDQEPPGLDGSRHVDFPASAPHIIACGGTNIQTNGASITQETVWNDRDGWATGGGTSTHFALPAWQSGLSTAPGTALTMRGVPDVAGDADPLSGINVRTDGRDGVSGGTSAVAPLWAALTAIMSQQAGSKLGFFAPLLYQDPAALNDIVDGDNTAFGVTGFGAQHGWDACTGLGSPIGTAVLQLFARTAPLQAAS